MESLVGKDTNVRVSSVLNRDVKQFGKKHLFDGDEETCWNSDQGEQQWIQLEFPTTVTVLEIQIKFQGGFVGSECAVMSSQAAGKDMEKVAEFYPEDINSLQVQGAHAGSIDWNALLHVMTVKGQAAEMPTNGIMRKKSTKYILVVFSFSDVKAVKCMRLVFQKSTDFFGRVTIYELDILGNKL